MRRRSFIGSAVSAPPGAVDKTAATVGSVCISNGTYIYFMPLTAWKAYSGTEYKAIGVTVAAVGDCGDSLVRVCSIPYMDWNTPDVGSKTRRAMGWNGYNTNIGGGITQTTNTNTAKADYNGKKNTTAILAKATGQSDWRTASVIDDETSAITNTIFTAACCCWRFHKLGTQQGDWYLPAVGELLKGYQNKTAVNASLKALGMKTAYDYPYWSSTSFSSVKAWFAQWNGTNVASAYRYESIGVRAFLAF